MKHLNPGLFTASRWRRCDPSTVFGIPWREKYIKKLSNHIKYYIVGYCKADKLVCRPKKDHYAIMFYLNDEYSWCHVTSKEFSILNK